MDKRIAQRDTRTRQVAEVRRLDERQHELRRLEFDNYVLVPLDEPVRAGWERYFVVRPDMRRSAEGRYLERVLAVVQKREVSGRKDFARRDWRHGNRMRPTKLQLGEVDAGAYWAMTPRMRTYFEPRVRRPSKRGARFGERLRVTFVVAQPWKFQVKVRVYWKTHERVYKFNGDSERAWIHVRLFGPQWRYRHLLRQRGDTLREWYGSRDSDKGPPDSVDPRDYDMRELE